MTAISGRGVGMDIVRANLERIGGAIAVESRPGQGTCITLLVPAVPPAERRPAAQDATPAARLSA